MVMWNIRRARTKNPFDRAVFWTGPTVDLKMEYEAGWLFPSSKYAKFSSPIQWKQFYTDVDHGPWIISPLFTSPALRKRNQESIMKKNLPCRDRLALIMFMTCPYCIYVWKLISWLFPPFPLSQPLRQFASWILHQDKWGKHQRLMDSTRLSMLKIIRRK